MRLHPRYTIGLLLAITLLSAAETGVAQGRREKKATPATIPASATTTPARQESVVMLPEGARQKVDTSLLNPEPSKRRRRFEVKVVPAAPPGRSRQEIMYTDSIANRSPRR